MDFPANPTLNQTYTYGGRTWRWNGTGWQMVSAPSAGSITQTMLAADARNVPELGSGASVTLTAAMNGGYVNATGGVTVPSGVFTAGNAVTIYNNSASNITITQGASVTLRQAGTATTGNRTLAQYGVATVLCVASNTFVISGAGLS